MLIVVGIFFIAPSASAINLGIGYGNNIGLGTNDPIVITLNFIRLFLGFLAFIAVILIIWSGFLWMTAGGDVSRVERAKKTLRNALIGVFIILFSFGIVSFVINAILDASRGQGGPGQGTAFTENPASLRALGDGIIEYVYPEPGQKDVPMNTVIVVTFREKIDPATICQDVSAGACADGSMLITENVRIFKDAYSSQCFADSPCAEALPAYVASSDNETFVFTPANRLGSVSEYSMKYSVYLTKDIKKANGSDAFRSLENGYAWSFSVSNVLDLTPPQVKAYGVFPPPDNAVDQSGVISEAVQATGRIEVVGQPKLYSPAQLLSDVTALPSSPAVTGTVDPHASVSGLLEIVVLSDRMTAVLSLDGNSMGSAKINGDTVSFPGIISIKLNNPSDEYQEGNSWQAQISAEVPSDTLTVGETTYVFSSVAGTNQIVASPDLNTTAANISNAINISNTKVSASVAGNVVTVTALVAGKLGNNIALYDNTSALDITPMSGGADRVEDVIVQGGGRDQPRNAVIQVNFNESVNPLSLSGSSDEVSEYIRVVNADGGAGAGASCTQNSDCLSYDCSSGACQGDRLAGRFLVSNLYKTVEFISDNECGLNTCGDKIYCLPENSRLKVELDAASLDGCGTQNCMEKSPYNNCVSTGAGSTCSDPEGHLYPLATLPFDGIVDMAANSLDGNRSGYADGPYAQSSQPPYNENAPNPTDGDDYLWSFYISDEIDVSAPVITKISQRYLADESEIVHDADNIMTDSPVMIYFDKLMMSATLITGEYTIDDPFSNSPATHKLINLWCLNPEQAVGYWITKENLDISSPLDNYPDLTKALLHHTKFGLDLSYRMQAGSGIKDIYQNCYSPSSRSGTDACFGGPSCCDGSPEAAATCP